MSVVIYGKILKSARVLAGISQAKLAAAVGVTQRSIARLEEDERQRLDVELANRVRVELERRGVEFTEPSSVNGVGVRFKRPDSQLIIDPDEDEK